MTPPGNQRMRWSDMELESFHADFKRHVEEEIPMHMQQKALYEAIFRLEDKTIGQPPGLLQTVAQINEQMHEMRVWQDRQKTFVGGIVFAISAVSFFLTDSAHRLMNIVKGL